MSKNSILKWGSLLSFCFISLGFSSSQSHFKLVSKSQIHCLNTPLQKPQKKGSYKALKQQILKTTSELKTNGIPSDSLSTLFEDIIVEQLIPYWYGTPWSFEGHTALPKQGYIACGYFVSTVLKDAGLQLNRYHLAQQNPLNEAKTLALNTPVLEFHDLTTENIIISMQERLDNGLYFIGFDQSHVGFLLKRKNQLFLIHSNYLNQEGVVIEPIETSEVFKSYDRFYLSELSMNTSLLRRWINGTEIKIIKE